MHDLVNGTLSDKAFVQFFGGGGSVEHGRHSVVRRNLFHDLYTFNPGNGAGMYCDAFTTSTIWEQNLVYHCGGTGNWYQHWGAGNVCRNNIMVNLPSPWQKQKAGSDNSIDTWNGGGYYRTDWHNSFEFSTNVVVATQGKIFSSVGAAEYANCSFRKNLYYSPGGVVPLLFPAPGGAAGSPNNSAQVPPVVWQGDGHDTDSLFGVDPKFVDMKGYDFKLAADSPAIKQLGFQDWDHTDVGPRLPVGPQQHASGLWLERAGAGDMDEQPEVGSRCTVESCFAQLPELCGSPLELSPPYAAHLDALCNMPDHNLDFPYSYDYDPATTFTAQALADELDAQNHTTPPGFTRELIVQSWAAAVLDQSSPYVSGNFSDAPVWAQVRWARRWAAKMYLLASDAPLDVSNKLAKAHWPFEVDAVTTSMLNRSTANSFAGFCGEAGNFLASVINTAVMDRTARQMCCWDRFSEPCQTSADCDSGGEGCVPSGTVTKKYGVVHCVVLTPHSQTGVAPPAVPYFLANNYPGYPDSGGLTHVLNTVPMEVDGQLVYATHDAYFSYEFVHCSNTSLPWDLRAMLKTILARQVSDLCVPDEDNRLYIPRMFLSHNETANTSEVTLFQTWEGFGSIKDKSTQFGSWVHKTLALFECPTAEDDVGNWYYYLLVAGWGGTLPVDFEAEVKALICNARHPCKLAPSHLPLCK